MTRYGIGEHDLVQERYRLQRPLGKGGMAEVWRAMDERLQRPVAIKFLASQFQEDPEFLVRFFSEAQSIAQITHPHVVQVLDFGSFEERPYLVMEYVGGGSAADLDAAPLLPERAADIVREVALGAGAAHGLGLVHRDIKPANILLTEDGRAKLADFGIASSVGGERLTATGQAIGSPHYISPEQASGAGCTPRSDVYSLGVVLYELITGRPPFDADNVTAIAIAHVEDTPEPPSTFIADLDPALETVILRCLSKHPDERYPDAAALAVALEDPVEAQEIFPLLPEAGFDEFPTGGRRVLAGVLMTALILGLLVAGVWAASGSSDPRPPSYDRETVDQGTGARGSGPREEPSPIEDANAGTTGTAGTASPSPSDGDQGKGAGSEEQSTEATGEGADATTVSDEPDEEPTPEPTSEPSPEPTAEPTSEPEPTPTAQDSGSHEETTVEE